MELIYFLILIIVLILFITFFVIDPLLKVLEKIRPIVQKFSGWIGTFFLDRLIGLIGIFLFLLGLVSISETIFS